MTTYKDVETAVKTQLETLTAFFPSAAQVTLADDRVLSTGVQYAALLSPGVVQQFDPSDPDDVITFEVICDFLVRYSKPGETAVAYEALRQAVIDLVKQNPGLGLAYYRDVKIAFSERPQYLRARNNPVWYMQTMTVTVSAFYELLGN